jgi:hypothetical protein
MEHIYIPHQQGYSGNDELVYEICDTTVAIQCTEATIHIMINPIVRDYHDLPNTWGTVYSKYIAGSNNTQTGKNPFWLGSKISSESNALMNIDATGDSYDDGLIRPNFLDSNNINNYKVILKSTSSGLKLYYRLMIDWNDDGTFEDNYSGHGITGISDTSIVGVNTPPYFMGGNVNYRLIVQLDSNLLNSNVLLGGEIEDYRILTDIPLPINFTEFNVIKWQNTKSKITWSVVEESEGVQYFIERASNDNNFKSIGLNPFDKFRIDWQLYIY